MKAERVRLVAFMAILAISMAIPRASGAQRDKQWWSLDVHAGYGPMLGDAGQVMHTPGLITGSVRFRKPESSWWFGVDINDVRASATPAGYDTLSAHAPSYITQSSRRAYYHLSSFSVSIKHDYASRGLFMPYGVGALGWGDSQGMICDAQTCAQSEGPLDGHPEHRPIMMIGGGAMVRLSDLVTRFKDNPLKLSAELRLVSTSTNHGSMVSVPLLVGISM
jgi:hypothetical protein